MNICSRDRELLYINFKFLIFMVIPVLLVVASLVVLYFGADFLVKGSSSLAVRFGISPLVVGLTVVAFGTSAPELLVSVQSALESNPGIAVGNVMGSNIFNVCAILGVSAMIYPLRVNPRLIRLDAPVMLVATLLSLCLICVAAIILIPVVLLLVGLPFLVLFALLPWLLRIAGVVLLLKALFEQPVRWENFMPAIIAFALSIVIGWIV